MSFPQGERTENAHRKVGVFCFKARGVLYEMAVRLASGIRPAKVAARRFDEAVKGYGLGVDDFAHGWLVLLRLIIREAGRARREERPWVTDNSMLWGVRSPIDVDFDGLGEHITPLHTDPVLMLAVPCVRRARSSASGLARPENRGGLIFDQVGLFSIDKDRRGRTCGRAAWAQLIRPRLIRL